MTTLGQKYYQSNNETWALLTFVHRHESLDSLLLLLLDRILVNLILLDCVRDLLLLLLLLAVLIWCHPLKLDLPPAVIHDHPTAWDMMMTLLVVSGANVMHPPVLVMGIGMDRCPVPSGIAPLAAASATDDRPE